MRTHRTKSAHLTAEYIPPTFLTRTPSPFCAGWRWGLLSRKIFSNFIFLILSRNLVNGFLRLNNFFIFFWIHYQLVLIILRFWFYFFVSPIRFLLVFYFFIFSDFRLVYPILGFWLNSFSEYLRFNSFIFARHYLDYDFWPRFWFSTRIFYFLDSFLLASISTCFSIVDSTFWLFNSLSLWLFCLL